MFSIPQLREESSPSPEENEKKKPSIDRYKKVPHKLVEGKYRYTNIPADLLLDLRSGKISSLMFNCLVWIRSRAGYYTGMADINEQERFDIHGQF